MSQLKLKPMPPKPALHAVPGGMRRKPEDQDVDQPRQHRLMKGALLLLLVTLGILVYRDRDFWFPDAEDFDDTVMQGPPAEVPNLTPSRRPPVVAHIQSEPTAPATTKKSRNTKSAAREFPASQIPVERSLENQSDDQSGAVVTERTVLPPLEVEVVAGDSHRTVRPGSNSLRVDMQDGVAARKPDAGPAQELPAATNNPAERAQMSAASNALVTETVAPDYPLLARQMKVQGSVVLQALIGRDGEIQNLRVISGPPILSGAAREAVKQWHFRPHYEGAEAVETQAKITVNFTISTN